YIPMNVFGAPAGLGHLVHGLDGFQLIQADEGYLKNVYQEIGRIMAALADEPIPYFGLRADGNFFVPQRESWRSEWVARTRQHHLCAQSLGTDLGALSQDLFAAAKERFNTLDSCKSWALSHGDLSPANLRFQAEAADPELVGVVYWPIAAVSDPRVDWAGQLFLPDEALAHVVEGYGQEQVEELMDDTAALELFFFGECLSRLRYAIDIERIATRGQAMRTIEHTRMFAQAALQPNWLKNRLDKALNQSEWGPLVQPPPLHVALRHGLDFLKVSPPLAADHTAFLLVVLGSSLLGIVHKDSGRTCIEAASRAAGALERPGLYLPCEPIEDLQAFKDSLLRAVVEPLRGQNPGMCLSLVACWLFLASIEELGDTVSSSVLRGGERLVRALVARESQSRKSKIQLQTQFAHAFFGLAAIAALPDLSDNAPGDLEPIAAALEQQLNDSWEQINPSVPAAAFRDYEFNEIFAALKDEGPFTGAKLIWPLTVLCLVLLKGRASLPASPRQMLDTVTL
ncbi:MAG: phosphotransferase, partial [Proteobacteria bacterium]|nr:phosphotransferase [Pseudomonadota bacterium]